MLRLRGSSLIEVLIALLITVLALLGLAGLQIAALRSQQVAHARTMATTLSQNLAERVRANITGARDGNYSFYDSSDGRSISQRDPSPDTVPDCLHLPSCSAAEVARNDLYEWSTALRNGLPGGRGQIVGNVKDGYTVTVYFREPQLYAERVTDTRASDTTRCPTLAPDVQCFLTVFVP